MKSAVAVICLALGIAGSPLLAQNAGANTEKAQDIRKLLLLTGGTKMMDQVLDAMGSNMKDPKAREFFQQFRKELDPNQIYDIIIPAYDKYLSAEDVKGIIRFYESPEGKKMVESMPKIMAEIMPALMQWSQQVAAKMAEKMKQQQQ